MALQDHQLELAIDQTAMVAKTQYTKGDSFSEYLTKVKATVLNLYRSDCPDGRISDDTERRLSVIIKKKYPAFLTDADHYHYNPPAHKGPVLQNIPAALTAVQYGNNEQPAKRREVAAVMGIVDKGHATHGSNFSAPQNLKQIIDNLFSSVSDAQAAQVAEKVKSRYGYDPRG